MESGNSDRAAAELAELKELEMTGFVEAAKDPLWVWPIIGLLAGFFLASFGIGSALISVLATFGYVLGVTLLVGTVVRRRGIQPRLSNLPGALKRVFVFYGLGVFVVVVTVLGIAFIVNFIVAGIVAFLLTTIGGIWYHVRWREAVDSLVAG